MREQQISAEDVDSWMKERGWQSFAFQSGMNGRKSFNVKVGQALYQVTVGRYDKVLYQGKSLTKAVKVYNSALEK